MEVYAVRHGQTDWNAVQRVQGRTDIPLNETGREQARSVAASLPDDIGIILSSPLKRALETAEIINERYGAEIAVDDRLMERDFGAYEGVLVSDIDINNLRRWTDNAPTEGGESIRDVAKRVFEYLDEIGEKYRDENVLIVTHGHVLRAVYWYYNGLPQGGGEAENVIEIENCVVFHF